MKLLKERSLNEWGLYCLALMFLILVAEYFIIRLKIERLEEVEEKKDYARTAQLTAQQIALMTHQFREGETTLGTEIIARLDQQKHTLEILKNGGRIEDTDIFLRPLSRLPRLSFDELNKVWDNYSSQIRSVILADRPPVDDSLAAVSETNAGVLLQAQWLTLSRWFERLEGDLTDEALSDKKSAESWVLIFIAADLLLLAGLYWLFHRHVIGGMRKLKLNLVSHQQDTNFPRNELGQITDEVNDLLEQLKDARDFVQAIATGDLSFDYRKLNEEYANGKNALADSLISMQDKLRTMNMEEQRRQWANDGLTKFVDILRSSNDNIHSLGDRIISSLVKYTGSNQGGLYVLNDDDEHNKYLELIAMFAFDNKKFVIQKIKLGEGILGQTFLERETTLLTEIPDEYVRITSGLGDANPKALVLVPLKVDEKVYGMVELASFRNYEQHEIAFVEKLGETIASTLASVKAAHKQKYLIEQFQQQTEQMRAQEEEMRQNMEELQATQEEMARKEREYIEQIRTLEEQSPGKHSTEEISQLKDEFQQREKVYHARIQMLENEKEKLDRQRGDWQLAAEMEKNLKFQLEALRISQEALRQD